MENKKLHKQLIVIIAFALIFGVLFFILYAIFAPPATCSDKKQNQNEKGIDCGGPCAPCKVLQTADLNVQETSFVFGGNATYDVVSKIYNPNDSVGAKKFQYTFSLKDAQGKVIATRTGSNFILPVDSKYVVELGLKTENDAAPAAAEIVITDPEWTPMGELEKPQLGIFNKKFDRSPSGVGSEAQGLLRNESSYDLNKISLVIILRGADGKILGINTTEKNVVRVNEERDFRLNWPYALSGNVQKMEVDAQSNVLDPNDFTVTR